MDPLKIEELFGRVQTELKTVGSERVQLFCIYEFLEALNGQYDEYESYLIQVMSSFPSLRNPLLFTGLRPSFLTDIIVECELVVKAIPSLSNDKELLKKLDYLKTGLFHINNWLGIRGEESGHVNLTSISDTGFVEGDIKDKPGEVFIPVVENSVLFPQKGRLRKLKVQLVGKSRKGEFELRPVFGVIGANSGDIGDTPAKAAGNLLTESVGKSQNWIGTASFELSHTWHAGSSANLALAGLYYCEMLKAENRREYFQINPGIAITGDIDKHGNVLEVDLDTLKYKTEAAFISWAQVLVVPMQQLERVQACLEELEREFPKRNLIVKGIGNLREVYFDRRLALHKETSLIEHTVKHVWKKKNTVTVVIVLMLLLSVIGRLLYGPIDKNPVSVEYSGDFLLLENKNGFEVGRIEAGFDAMISLELNYAFNPKVLLYDINEDGFNEVIWSKNASSTQRERTFVQAYSLSGDSVIWEMTLTMNYEFPRQHFEMDQTLDVKELAIVESGNDTKLVVVGNLSMFFPATVSIANIRTGEIEQEYVHTGRFSDMTVIDINEDGKEEIILTGVNNAFWMASIIVLDLENIQGHSPLNRDYVISDLDKADEMFYMVMPKTITGEYLSYMEKQAIGHRIFTNSERKTLMVEIYETQRQLDSTSERSSYFLYLNYNMQATGFATSDLYDIIAHELYEEGHIPFIPDYDYWESFKDSLLYWNGQEFVNEPVTNREYLESSDFDEDN